MFFKFYWYSFWLRVAYLLRLRGPFIQLQRWFKGENNAPRKPVPVFATPQAIIDYARPRFKFRSDTGRIGGWIFPLDWITEPEVFQYKLDDPNNVERDGDCDDYHFWVAAALSKIEGVSRIYLLSTGYAGGAHATVVYKYGGGWYHVDYTLYSLNNPNQAPVDVARKYGRGGDKRAYFWLFETYDPPWRAVAISPNKLEV